VTSDDLTPDQAEAVKTIVRRQFRFLSRLQERMNRLNFPTDDPLWLGAVYARNAARWKAGGFGSVNRVVASGAEVTCLVPDCTPS
jgi:hypothetical protein